MPPHGRCAAVMMGDSFGPGAYRDLPVGADFRRMYKAEPRYPGNAAGPDSDRYCEGDDLVHWFGNMAVPRGFGVASRRPSGLGRAARRPLYSRALG